MLEILPEILNKSIVIRPKVHILEGKISEYAVNFPNIPRQGYEMKDFLSLTVS